MVKIRRAYEALFLGLFLFFLIITDLRYLRGWPVSLFLEATPLVAVSTALTTHTLYRNLVWGLVVIAITMMLGRVWCNWMCPFGILHHFFGWIGNRRNTKQTSSVEYQRAANANGPTAWLRVFATPVTPGVRLPANQLATALSKTSIWTRAESTRSRIQSNGSSRSVASHHLPVMSRW